MCYFSRIFFCLTFLFFGFVSYSEAASYYVDAIGGNDGNDGLTVDTAWQSATPINARTFAPGDTVYFKRGVTFSNFKVTLHNESGTDGNPITFDAYGTGADPILDGGTQNRIFDIRNSASYITIQNLVLQNPTESGIFLFTGTFTGLNFNNLTITGTSTAGILFQSASSASGIYDNLTIQGFATGMNFSESSGDTLSNLSITAGTIGLRMGTSLLTVSNVILEDSSIRGISGQCVYFGNIDGATIDSVNGDNCGAEGIYFVNSNADVSINDSSFSDNAGRGIRFTGKATGASITSTEVSNNDSDGILLTGGSSGSEFSDLTVNGNGLTGINATLGGSSDTLTISSSEFNNNGASSESNGVAINGSAGSATLSYVTANGNTNDGFGIHNGPTVNIDNAIANENGVDGVGSDGDGYSFHSTSSGTISNSYAWNNKKSAVTNIDSTSVDIYNSVFGYTNTSGTNALITFLNSASADVYNNTLVNPSQEGTAISLISTGTVALRNNLIYGFDIGIYKDVSAVSGTEDYNIVANTATSAVSGSGFSLGSNSATTDPFLEDVDGGDYQLTSRSDVAVNTGTDSLCSASDKEGVTREGGCDIGAYEFIGTLLSSIQEEDDSEDSKKRDLDVHDVKATATANSITITWKTKHSTKTTLRYGTDKEIKIRKKGKVKEKSHTMTLTDLQPGTLYYFRIKASDSSENDDRSRIHSIITRPLPARVATTPAALPINTNVMPPVTASPNIEAISNVPTSATDPVIINEESQKIKQPAVQSVESSQDNGFKWWNPLTWF